MLHGRQSAGQMSPDNAEDLLVIGIASRVGYLVKDASGVIRRRDLALDVHLMAVRLYRQVNQEAGSARLAQSDRAPAAIPVWYLNEIILTKMVDRHLHGPTRGDHKFSVAAMVNRLMGPVLAALPTVNIPESRTAPRTVAGSGVTVGPRGRAGSSLRW